MMDVRMDEIVTTIGMPVMNGIPSGRLCKTLNTTSRVAKTIDAAMMNAGDGE